LRLATFNVLHGRPLFNGRPVHGPADGPPEGPLVDAVGLLDADVVALQELDRLQERSGGVDQARVAAAAAGATDWRYASAWHARSEPGKGWVLDAAAPQLGVYGAGDDGGIPSHGIALLTRLPVRSWHVRRLASAPLAAPLIVAGRRGLTMVHDQPRAVLAAVIEGDCGPFTAVAVHLSFVYGWNAAQLVAVRRWIADLPRPHVVLGDFNMIGPIPQLVLGRGWRSLVRTPTYPAHRPVVQFDHVVAAGIGRSVVRATGTPHPPVSDHRPVTVDLAW
jgi:endonuclease/exonuclease/phosphatase family metal-dependent hydrolase